MGLYRDWSGSCDPAGFGFAGGLLVVPIRRSLDRYWDLVYSLLLGGKP